VSEIGHVLIVDDESFCIDIIREVLAETGAYKMSFANNGQQALDMLEATPMLFDVVLLDQHMPGLSGFEVLKKMKMHPVLCHCPVVFQSANASNADIAKGLKAGAHYYLTKPYDNEVLYSVVETAVCDYQQFKNIQVELNSRTSLLGLLTSASFEFTNLEQARALSVVLSKACPDPAVIVTGLTELMLNAIEHGNLAISYAEKSKLNANNTWLNEVSYRLSLPAYSERKATVSFVSNDAGIEITIKDQGEGFDWKPYLDFDPHRAMDSHGRGIALANTLSFSSLEYRGDGNEVCARVAISTERAKSFVSSITDH